ncbi:PREDICTED: Na(+)/H(+) exchange regulatory cofactor NHE-RF4-like [Thamnophis sirtalis]|uniref:Na(+)/H(+) exchange regulatory cofactor NHE-RF4-like n=1 Tax=Thamnophis sirtalis TaxID=35019 RepID=A0A6I9XJY3_9SAUR|nr:PREDICTED: Na(+)/H(+) exchange regulatory cofactor NHE-RF4-like [Thamnophis sirtalis]
MKQKTGLQDTPESTMKFEFNPKEGIDNPALSLAEDSEPEGASRIRFCLLKKEVGDNLGFSLCQEAGGMCPVVRKVTPGGLAYRKGLRDGDRILEVNGVNVEGMGYLRVIWKIKSSSKQVLLTLLDGNAYEVAKALNQDLNQLLSRYGRPRLCCLPKGSSGLGFSVSAPEGVTGVFQLSVLQDGPAQKAGVPHGSWLVELNGVSVKNWTTAQLNQKLRQSSSPMGLLVIDSRSEEAYRQCGVKVTAALADASWVPFQVTKLQMTRGEDGYGFLMKEEKSSSGKRAQFLRELDAGLPAEKAGMREGDCLLAVNGEIVEDLEHQEVVSRIRSDNQRVTLLVIDSEGSKFYNMVGVSPLAFYDGEDFPSSFLITRGSTSPGIFQEQRWPPLRPCHCQLSSNTAPPGQPDPTPWTFTREGHDGFSQAF